MNTISPPFTIPFTNFPPVLNRLILDFLPPTDYDPLTLIETIQGSPPSFLTQAANHLLQCHPEIHHIKKPMALTSIQALVQGYCQHYHHFNYPDPNTIIMRPPYNTFSSRHIRAITVAIRNQPSLTALDISKNKTHGQTITQKLSEYHHHWPGLRRLNLSNNHLTPSSIGAVSKIIPSSLTALNIAHNQIGDDGLHRLIKSLPSSIQTLNLCNNRLTHKSAHALYIWLMHNYTLIALNLSMNNLGSIGALDMAMALTKNMQLTSLIMSHNNILTIGAKAFGDALKHNRTLAHLILNHNSIDDTGLKELSDSLSSHPSLRELSLLGHHFSPHCIDQFFDRIKHNPMLSKVGLSPQKNRGRIPAAIY